MSTRVLIVEDEPEFLRRFADAVLSDRELALAGAVVNGAAAKAMLDAQPVDVLLVDLGLPDMDGVEVIRHAVARHPACDVMVVTMFGVITCHAPSATSSRAPIHAYSTRNPFATLVMVAVI